MLYLKLDSGVIVADSIVGVVKESCHIGTDYNYKFGFKVFVLGHFYKELLCVCDSKQIDNIIEFIRRLISISKKSYYGLNLETNLLQCHEEFHTIILEGNYDIKKINNDLVIYLKTGDKENETKTN